MSIQIKLLSLYRNKEQHKCLDMVTKTEKAIALFQQGNYLPAFKIFSRFRRFSNDELRIIQIAHECYSGNASFYVSLGIDVEVYISRAVECISKKYIFQSSINCVKDNGKKLA